ncbi:hypothetical protein PC113_g20826 [Phytophthora cactorum]|uniref:Tc1-like transposase DDE domain-containing protein n=1 Tax=Phytophthora cactorum TaxID=29920 RepID=A0A8T0Y9B1_9STRA|nr:hypothetical protein PC113_g20826 [Phytophthora cactorum]
MVWPARSPDSNSIENVWSAMVSRVYAHGHQYGNVDQLEAAIFAAGDSIEQVYILKLMEAVTLQSSKERKFVWEFIKMFVLAEKGDDPKYLQALEDDETECADIEEVSDDNDAADSQEENL